MRHLNREQWVFLAALPLVVLLGYGVVSSYRDAPVPVPRSQPAEPLAIAMRDARPLRDGERDPRWSEEGRNAFEEPREEQELPPLDLPLPPLPARVWIEPPVPPWPSPRVLPARRVPSSVAAPEGASGAGFDGGSVADSPGGLEGGSNGGAYAASPEPAGGEGGGATASALLPAPVRQAGAPAAKAPAKPPSEVYDRIHKGSEVIYGKILTKDPLAIAEEDDREPGRFRLKPGEKLDFAVFDVKANRRRMRKDFRGGDVDTFALAETPENEYRVRRSRIGPDMEAERASKERLLLATWCEEKRLFPQAFENYRLVESIDPLVEREGALGAARAAEALWRFDEARAALARAIEKTPEDARLHAAAGRIEDRLGLAGLAEASHRRALQLDPGQWGAALRLAHLRLRAGALGEARELFQKVASGATSLPEKAEAHAGLALVALIEGRLDAALAAVSRASENRASADALALRAAILDAKGDTAGAERAVREALALDPDCASARTALAVLQARLAAPEAALATAESARLADPVHPFWALAAKGYALLRLGRREAALAAFKEAGLAAPWEPYGHYVLGRFSLLLGNTEAAQASLRRALELAPDFVECALALADAALREEDREAAQRYLRYAGAFGPETAETFGLWGYSNLLSRRFAEAEQAFEKAREKEPDDPLATVGLAYIQYRKGGDGVYRAVESLKSLAERAAKEPSNPFCSYAAQWHDAIRDNISKVEWRDTFAREQIKQGWDEIERAGVTISIDKQRVRIGGMQSDEHKTSSLEKPLDGARLLQYQVSLDAPPNLKAFVGLSLTRATPGQSEGIYFGKDPQGRVVFRAAKPNKPGDWVVVEGLRWPSNGKATLALEKIERDAGWRLVLNGTPVVPSLGDALAPKLTGSWRIGVFGHADLGVEWTAYADDVRVLLQKK
jgi:tetratricopeptide (TPR) repeat protein